MSTERELLFAGGVAKGFASGLGRVEVLRGASLTVREGESISIRGESGCGKTTLLNIISRLERPDSGELRWNGADVLGMGAGALAKLRGGFLGLVFQSYYLVPELDVLGNVLLAARVAGLKADRERALSLLERMGLAERVKASPLTLSGGERQRAAVARALMNRPRVVLADEPTGNLDERNADVVMGMLMEACRAEGASLVLVTHSRRFAAMAHTRYILAGGILSHETA
jgi:ABC-type lipoprotein export system ATPase subunit